MAMLASLLTGLLSALLFAYTCLAFPLWVGFSCARDGTLGAAARRVWMVLIVVLFPVGSWLYALLVSKRLLVRLSSVLSFAMAGLAVHSVVRFVEVRVDALRARIATAEGIMGNSAISVDDDPRAQMLARLDTLKSEVSGSPGRWDDNASISTLVDTLLSDLHDRRLQDRELDDWRRLYDGRHLHPGSAVDRAVRSLQALLNEPQSE